MEFEQKEKEEVIEKRKMALEIANEILPDYRLSTKRDRLIYNYNTILTCEGIDDFYLKVRGISHVNKTPFLSSRDLLETLLDIEKQTTGHFEQIYKTDMEFALHFFAERKVQELPSGIIVWEFDGRQHTITTSGVENELLASMEDYNRSLPRGAPRFGREQMRTCVSRWQYANTVQRIDTLRECIKYDPNQDFNDEAWIQDILTVYYIESTPENVLAFQHLLWMIKRKLWGYPIGYPVFFCLQGRQGTGKTEFFHCLVKPFDWIYSDQGSLGKMMKPNDLKSMIVGKYLIDNQELTLPANIWERDKVFEAVSTLKSVISSETVANRQMYNIANEVVANTGVFVSSTNKHIFDTLPDSQMRRFWEFNIKLPTRESIPDYGAANKIFGYVTSLFKAIDENDELGFYHPDRPNYRKMIAIQNGYCSHDSLLAWVYTQSWEFCEERPDAKKITLSALRQKFNTHLRTIETGQTGWGSDRVRRMLANSNYDPTMDTTPGVKDLYYYWIREKK